MKKNIVITGAGRGIGKATAIQLAELGHEVWALSRNVETLEPLAANLPNLHPVKLDINDAAALQNFGKQLSEYQTTVDVLINNAGALVNKPFNLLERADFELCYRVNVFVAAEMIQVLMPLFASDVHVINISSMGGFQGSMKFAGLAAYSSAKAAVVGLTECLQEEYKSTGWAFNCLCLGSVQTEMLEAAFPGYQASLSPEEMGEYITQFALTAHKAMRGKIIPVSITNP